MRRKITSHWQPLFSKKMAEAASFSYKIGGGGLIFLQNWWRRHHFLQNWWRRQGFGNITGGCSDMVWILAVVKVAIVYNDSLYWRNRSQTVSVSATINK